MRGFFVIVIIAAAGFAIWWLMNDPDYSETSPDAARATAVADFQTDHMNQ